MKVITLKIENDTILKESVNEEVFDKYIKVIQPKLKTINWAKDFDPEIFGMDWIQVKKNEDSITITTDSTAKDWCYMFKDIFDEVKE